MAEGKICPFIIAAIVGGYIRLYQAGDRCDTIREAAYWADCMQDRCGVWVEDCGCGLRNQPGPKTKVVSRIKLDRP